MNNFKYKSNNDKLKRIAKLYPYKTSLYANVYFHIIDNDYDARSLDVFLERYCRLYHPEYYDYDADPYFKEDEYISDEFDDDFDDELSEEEEDYLNELYDEYTDDVIEFLSSELKCDTVIGLKFSTDETCTTFDQCLNEVDRNKFRTVIIGIRYTNTIDQKVYSNYKSDIMNNSDFEDMYNSIRQSNMMILKWALDEGDIIPESAVNIAISVLIKYMETYYSYMIPRNGDTATVTIDNNGKENEITIQHSVGLFSIGAFALEYDLNNYGIDELALTKIIDDTYCDVIKFSDVVSSKDLDSLKKFKVYKYDDGSVCIAVRNDEGCTYLYMSSNYLGNNKK